MVKVTLEIPEELLGDVYMAVGKVLRRGYEEDPEMQLTPDPEFIGDGDETEA